MVTLAGARAPDGMRLYAIGDVHGCAEALADIYARIEADLAARPPGDWRIIHIGDYIDRGGESRGVIDHVARRVREGRVYALCGNHDHFMREFLADPDCESFPVWMTNGGAETLISYGLSLSAICSAGDAYARAALHAELTQAVPPAHRWFLEGLPLMLRLGDYAFVHAGVRPDRALERQSPEDLLWIRDPFLSSDADFGAVVVHGHTPTGAVTVRPNRIGIDTGAVFGGPLSCLVLEGRGSGLLQPEGVVALDAAPGAVFG